MELMIRYGLKKGNRFLPTKDEVTAILYIVQQLSLFFWLIVSKNDCSS